MRTAGGFTLIELVMVILLLGIMATFASQFIGIGSQIYGDASSREQLMSDARFAMERLNREVRDALPGSERIETLGGSWDDSGPCLRFWPISTSSRYLALNRAPSGSTSTLELVMATPASAVDPMSPDANAVKAGDLMVVFPLPTSAAGSLVNGCEYGRCVARVTEGSRHRYRGRRPFAIPVARPWPGSRPAVGSILPISRYATAWKAAR